MKRVLVLCGLAAFLVIVAGPAGGVPNPALIRLPKQAPPPSGAVVFRDVDLGTGLTECPQAGLSSDQPQPLDRRTKDLVERFSSTSSDVRANQDYSCFPQNETSIAVNPRNPLRNIVAGANEYRTLSRSGFYSSTDGGKSWYDGELPPPSLGANPEILDASGDPALAFDRDGVVYYATINFNRSDDTNTVTVQRSTNGGFTWSRACVPIPGPAASPNSARCGGTGDPRAAGDGVVIYDEDPDESGPIAVNFHDKEFIAVGPRPAGVTPTCYTPVTRTPTACNPAIVGSDRIYVTWTLFEVAETDCTAGVQPPCFETSGVRILESHSDDQARSWSPPQTINGSAPFCIAFFADSDECDASQASVPTVNPATGHVFVAFENFNTPDENQYVVVRSRDGGSTWEDPLFVGSLYDVNFPTAGVNRLDCSTRGQQGGRDVLTNSCFRVPSFGNIVVDKRGGAFADDLYVVYGDNRNGTRVSSNSDVFLFKSTDGGLTWIGPTRVNNDASTTPANRDCGRGGRPACPTGVHTGNDQWWPWVDMGENGELNVVFYDRRLDTTSVEHEWGSFSRQRPGNYLVWLWGAQCTVTTADSRECTAPSADLSGQPTAPVNPGPADDVDTQTSSPIANFPVSDVPSNFDYSFRAGIFAGDYNSVAVGGSQAFTVWTDARNGRSSGGPAGGPVSSLPSEPGRNPICEQSDLFFDSYGAAGGGGAGPGATPNDSFFLVALCPRDALDPSYHVQGN